MTHHSLLCSSVAHLIEPWHDGELSLDEQIVVEGHLAVCAACSATARELQELRQLLHAHGEPGDTPAIERTLEIITQTVVSRARAERDASFTAQVSRMFEDLHFVWAATAACVAVIAAVLQFAPAQRDDSLSGVLAALAAEPGSNRNPLRLDERTRLPRLDEDDNVSSEVLESLPDPSPLNASPLMIAGVLTQEGRVSHASVLPSWEDREARRRVIDAVAGVRFQPAQRGGTPVAVNLLWLVEHTTVRGKI
jgi:Putative zinc-finger